MLLFSLRVSPCLVGLAAEIQELIHFPVHIAARLFLTGDKLSRKCFPKCVEFCGNRATNAIL